MTRRRGIAALMPSAARFACALLATAWLAAGRVSHAQPAADFYRGKVVHLLVGYTPGGGYDLYARLLARHMPKHIPGNPSMIVQNMPGAGSMKATLYLADVAPRDGTYIGTVGRTQALAPLLQDAKFDGSKLSWIGSISDDVSLCVVSPRSPIKTFADLLKHDAMFAGYGAGSDPTTLALTLARVLGGKVKVIGSYPGTQEIALALERGEIDGSCGISLSTLVSQRPGWLDGRDATLLVQMALAKSPRLPQVPVVLDLVSTEEQRQIVKLLVAPQAMARPFFGPPGIPANRRDILRAAFDATMRDPDFLAEAAKTALEVNPMTGQDIEALVSDLYATPRPVIEKAAAAVR